MTQIPQDISDPNLNSFNKRNMAESSSVPRRSERPTKERNLDLDFIDSQAIIFLVEEAIDDEVDSPVSNNTWELLDLPPGSKAIGQGVDYFDTYASVARITSIRVLFALDSIYNLPIHQMDVKTAFLNVDFDEEVYMKQPEGFVLPGHENKVCKLKKSLYGLKQAPKQWHDKFDESILSNGFTHNSSDRCIYSKFTKDYEVILCLYVDDILIVRTNMEDASWITGSSDSKSTTGWIFTLGGRATCWGLKKQTCITHSTIEAEFLALAAVGKEVEWLRNMLLDIELWPQPMSAISLHYDSQSTLSKAYNKVYNGKFGHISLRHVYIKELISIGIITIESIRSCKNLADPFTKGMELQERWV
nr:peroxidase 72 [Tanacetum cinerariifolium]